MERRCIQWLDCPYVLIIQKHEPCFLASHIKRLFHLIFLLYIFTLYIYNFISLIYIFLLLLLFNLEREEAWGAQDFITLWNLVAKAKKSQGRNNKKTKHRRNTKNHTHYRIVEKCRLSRSRRRCEGEHLDEVKYIWHESCEKHTPWHYKKNNSTPPFLNMPNNH